MTHRDIDFLNFKCINSIHIWEGPLSQSGGRGEGIGAVRWDGFSCLTCACSTITGSRGEQAVGQCDGMAGMLAWPSCLARRSRATQLVQYKVNV